MLVIVKSQFSEGFISERMDFGNGVALKTMLASFGDFEFSFLCNFTTAL